MTYKRKWVPIKDALELVVSATGLDEDAAKEALCEEISDRNIRIRQQLAEEPGFPAKAFEGLLNEARINKNEIDFLRSRPSRKSPAFANSPLIVGPKSFRAVCYEVYQLIERKVIRLEVSIEDVTRVFSGTTADTKTEIAASFEVPTIRLTSGKGAKSKGVERAIEALYPGGIPSGKSSAEASREIIDWLKVQKLSIPTSRTVERVVASRRKPAIK